MKEDLIALFDMDGTLFDYDGSLKREMNKLKSPGEKTFSLYDENKPDYIKKRIDLITSSESFWENMPKFDLGWGVLETAKNLDYKIMILTQGPRKNPFAWSGKKKCIDKHFGENFDITLTRDKGLVYGKVLVDDFPGYIERWIKWRKRGQVIMPANESNKNYKHPQVIRYTGENLREVINSLKEIKDKSL